MFKYFFEGALCEELSRDGKLQLERLGQAEVALRDCRAVGSQCHLTQVTANCELGPGVIIDPFPADGSRPGLLGYLQDWRWVDFDGPIPGKQALIGYDPNATFQPDLLRRRRMIQGETLRDPNREEFSWLIPVARSPGLTYGALSTRWAPQRGGKLARVLAHTDQWLWDLSGEVQDYLIWRQQAERPPRPEWEDPWAIERAIQLLGVNYRIGMPEMAALTAMYVNPLSDLFALTALHALLGYGHWQAWIDEIQKKTNPAMSPAPVASSSGSGAVEAAPADLAAAS